MDLLKVLSVQIPLYTDNFLYYLLITFSLLVTTPTESNRSKVSSPIFLAKKAG